jgi:hypothetical protein
MKPNITFRHHIKTELTSLSESILKETDFDIKSYIEGRLKKYSQEHDDNFEALKDYFNNNTDIINPKTPQEEEEAYMKLLHDFLDSVGY